MGKTYFNTSEIMNDIFYEVLEIGFLEEGNI
jgi:hypothetical protein